ncbi:F-box-containing protein [Glarea lozoyensis ATCC 20868]|uniref:F-box-containing protein n=1 Tax=Glarea lozoyensis (strain ATCC 20868 / MF5171) TaxID=1116229 RepID=S3DE63_GLAL2|nr:F-box-containing protein [Glarea lozoyensis ATCC 20868]EPE35384.1 F-box-containing protein [Glarea lozoyensis ATCC 20868]
MRSIPGYYIVWHAHTRKRRFELVSVKAAKELAIKVHGSVEKMSEKLYVKSVNGLSVKNYTKFRFLQDAPLQQPYKDPSSLLWGTPDEQDDYCGMAAVAFPFVMQRNSPEDGVWCGGCNRTYQQFVRRRLPPQVILDKIPPGIRESDSLLNAVHRARSKAGFQEHIKHCSDGLTMAPMT